MSAKNVTGIKARIRKLRRKIRDKRSLKEKKYKKLRRKFLRENTIDLIFLFVFGKFQESTCIHHANGRGFWLNNIDYFIATSIEGDKWIHRNEELAKELGFITEDFFRDDLIKTFENL